jgi:hypothetical protein
MPVVARHGAMAEAIELVNGLTRPGDATDLAAQLWRLIDEPSPAAIAGSAVVVDHGTPLGTSPSTSRCSPRGAPLAERPRRV